MDSGTDEVNTGTEGVDSGAKWVDSGTDEVDAGTGDFSNKAIFLSCEKNEVLERTSLGLIGLYTGPNNPHQRA